MTPGLQKIRATMRGVVTMSLILALIGTIGLLVLYGSEISQSVSLAIGVGMAAFATTLNYAVKGLFENTSDRSDHNGNGE